MWEIAISLHDDIMDPQVSFSPIQLVNEVVFFQNVEWFHILYTYDYD